MMILDSMVCAGSHIISRMCNAAYASGCCQNGLLCCGLRLSWLLLVSCTATALCFGCLMLRLQTQNDEKGNVARHMLVACNHRDTITSTLHGDDSSQKNKEVLRTFNTIFRILSIIDVLEGRKRRVPT